MLIEFAESYNILLSKDLILNKIVLNLSSTILNNSILLKELFDFNFNPASVLNSFRIVKFIKL